jgi:hypothetical protein
MEYTEEIGTNALLSEFAYIKFENYIFDFSNEDLLRKFIDSSESGVDDDRKEAMKNLLNDYTIVEFKNSPTTVEIFEENIIRGSDMQALLLEEKGSGDKVIAFRGSEGLFDFVAGEVIFEGDIPNQMVDAMTWVEGLKVKGELDGGATVTGHSLGGSLAQLIAYVNGYEAYTYNAIGIKRNHVMDNLVGDDSQIYNFQLGLDIVSGLATQISGPGIKTNEMLGDLLEGVSTADSFSWFMPDGVGKFIGRINVASKIKSGWETYNNYMLDQTEGSFLGSVTTFLATDDSNFWDFVGDHYLTGFYSAFDLYTNELPSLFQTNEIEQITAWLGIINAAPSTGIDVSGMPRIIEQMSRTVGKLWSDGTSYNDISNAKDELQSIKNIIGDDKLTVFDFNKWHIKSELEAENKAILYNILHLLPPIIIDNDNHALYKNTNFESYSENFLGDRSYFYNYYNLGQEAANEKLLSGADKRHYVDMTTGEEYGYKYTALLKAFWGEHDKKVIFGTSNDDAIEGDDYEDHLYGMGGNDTIYGGKGDDYLEGGEGADELYGGYNYDTYITDDGDYIKDEDGRGEVHFEKTHLTGGTKVCTNGDDASDAGVYKGDGGEYTWSEGDLIFEQDGKYLIIDNFKNGDLGITLKDICTPLLPDSIPTPKGPYHHGSPLILDLNGDGATSTFIYDTKTYFDLDNDGMRERTGWVQSGDGLLVLDKNSNGIIDNGNELFGNYTKDAIGAYSDNGFDALVQYDTNKDGVIDSNDDIYSVLQVWQDANNDGITNVGELYSLSELGVASINLSYVTIDALEERNSIFQTSTFTTTGGDTQIINDVWFDTDAQDTLRVYGGTYAHTSKAA